MYPNGEVPTSLLVQRPSAGKDPCLMMPGTAAKHDRLVQLGAAHGWVPLVSGPSDGYRTVAVQEYYYDTMPAGQAAYPRTSSHGGTYNFGDGEVEQGAVDYGNWADLGWDLFEQLTRAAGFVPGVFIGRPGIPDEYWHLFDPSPWDTTSTLEDDMLNDDDKNWITQTVRGEIGAAISAYTPSIADAAGKEPLNASETDWIRSAVRQEIGGAMAAYIPKIAEAVAAALPKA